MLTSSDIKSAVRRYYAIVWQPTFDRGEVKRLVEALGVNAIIPAYPDKQESSSYDNSFLVQAVVALNEELVDFLLSELHADPNLVVDGCTVLYEMIWTPKQMEDAHKQLRITENLLRHGANPDVVPKDAEPLPLDVNGHAWFSEVDRFYSTALYALFQAYGAHVRREDWQYDDARRQWRLCPANPA